MASKPRVMRFLKICLLGGISCGVAAGLSAIVGVTLYGSPYAFLDISKGHSISVRPLNDTYLTLKVGEEKTVHYRVVNLTSRPVRLNGISVNCSCVVPPRLPISLAPNERREIALTVKPIPSQSGKVLTQYATFLTNSSGPHVAVSIVVRVL
jgi:hypothetical protein